MNDPKDLLPKVEPPKPPEPPSYSLGTLPQKQQEHKPTPDFIKDHLGTDSVEAAIMAFNEPDLWKPDELALFEEVIAGVDYPEEEFVDLIKEYATGSRKRETQRLEQPVASVPDQEISHDEDPGPPEVDHHNPLVIDPSIEMGSIDVGNWWEK